MVALSGPRSCVIFNMSRTLSSFFEKAEGFSKQGPEEVTHTTRVVCHLVHRKGSVSEAALCPAFVPAQPQLPPALPADRWLQAIFIVPEALSYYLFYPEAS